MPHVLSKCLRTIQVEFPGLLDLKFALMRRLRLATRRPFELEFRALTDFAFPPQALFLDVGGNRGQSIDAILMFCPQSQIVSFEPNPILATRLRRMFAHNHQVRVEPVGLGDKDVTSDLHIPFYKRWMFDGLASFDFEFAHSWLQGRIYGYDERHVQMERVPCRIRRLDEFGLSPAFIKLDIQGYELPALQGGEDTIRKHHPVVLVEAPDQGIQSFMSDLGYEYFKYHAGRFTPRALGAPNTFFLHDVHLTKPGIRKRLES